MSEALRPLGDLSNFVVFAMALVVVLFFPNGFFGLLTRTQGRRLSMAERAHLEVAGLTKRFGGLVAVKEMTLAVDAGKILGLIGPNGSGKSTVMKLIMGIERPDAGSVRINGVEVAGWPSHKIARMGAGIVFQHSRPLHRQTVLENIKLALLPDKLTAAVRRSADRRTRARHRRARRLERRARPPPGHAAVRRSAQDRDRQGDRARSAGAADRRAVRRAHRRRRPRRSPI